MQKHPGVLVFRTSHAGLPARLCVLLVGESPVAGINRSQFSNALSLVEADKNAPLAILGPTFSGSIESLGTAIGAAKLARPLRVVTGTATARDNAERLSKSAETQVDFEQLTSSDDVSLKTFLNYVQKKTTLDHVALLTESGTEYGKIKDGNLKVLHYPLEISRLRNAYANDPSLATVSTSKSDQSPAQGLDLSLKDKHDSEDTFPTFSNELRPVSQEATILDTLASLSQSRIQYVGIVATDVLDSLFLGHLLRQHCPNVRPFILDADLIYGHVSQNNAFDGMLMVSGYPLIRNFAKPDPNQFSSAIEKGEFQATLHAISSVTGVTGNAPEDRRPAPTISVMGRDGIWPVETGANAVYDLTPSTGWKLLFSLVSLSCLLFGAALIHFSSGKHQSGFLWLSALLTSTPKTRWSLTLATSVLLLFYCIIADVELHTERGFGYLVCAVTLATLLTALASAFTTQKVWQAIPVLLIFGALFWSIDGVHSWQSAALISRSIHVGNGVSPITPLLFITASLVWWAYSQLTRVRLLNLFPEKSAAFCDDSYLNSAESLQHDLFCTLHDWHTGNVRWIIVLAFLLALSMILLNPLQIFSLETFPFERIYAVALYALYFGLLMECLRFVRAWTTLRNLLNKMEHHVLCDVFKRLPDELAPSYLWKFGSRGPSLLIVAHFVNRLKLVADKQISVLGDRFYDNKLNDIRQYTRDLMTGGHARPRMVRNAIIALNRHIDEVLCRLVAATSDSWGSVAITERAMAHAVGGQPAQAQTTSYRLAADMDDVAEEMIALRFVEVVAHVNLHMKNDLSFISGALILAVISINCYPFEPHHTMTSMLTLFFIGAGLLFLSVFMQMSRNTIISYLNNTQAGKLDGSVFHLLSFGGLPLIAVISSQFPTIGGFLFAWVKPALEALR